LSNLKAGSFESAFGFSAADERTDVEFNIANLQCSVSGGEKYIGLVWLHGLAIELTL
jgi:hypothetical protein